MATVWLTCCVVFVLGHVSARPYSEIEKLTSEYAQRHPNTETTKNEEYGRLFEGDIVLKGKNDKPEPDPLNAVVNPARLWPGGIIYYAIRTADYNPTEIAQIEAGIADLVEKTKVNGSICVQILPWNREPDWVAVESYSGCSSYIGRVGGVQRISLVASCVTRHGTIMHEFLHAFGFYHEQSRSDRDDYVTINWDNIQPGYENNFAKMPPDQIDHLGTLYDYGGVMHYGAYAFAIDPNVPTIIPHDPDAQIGQRVELSEADIERVQILYKCITPAQSKHFKHLA